ncbi:MAG: hypothetical protein ACOY94_10365 [Bacillota bacterium]
MAHLTAAVSEGTFVRLFEALRDNFAFSKADSGSFAGFTAGYSVAAHLEGGSVDLRADNTVQVKELDIKFDTLDLSLGIDIPEICVGGFCIIPNPFGGCLLKAPKFCVFDDNPDISLTLPLGGLITSEVSFTGSLRTEYAVDPARLGWMNDWDALDAGVPNQWHVHIDPQTIDLDLFDIADMVGDLLENAVNLVVDGLLGWLPGWARDLIKAILGPVIDLIRAILDIADDIQEWISDLLNVSFGLMDLILTFVADYFAAKEPIAKFDDPLQILEAQPTKVAVLIPVRDLNVFCNDDEMVLEANVG